MKMSNRRIKSPTKRSIKYDTPTTKQEQEKKR